MNLANKYRPSTLSAVYGHELLVKSLHAAIINDSIAHVYLLTGSSGIGKTSIARIIANTINCEQYIIEQYVAPCRRCNNCINFISNQHPDIIEMDAASRTSVDDIRLLIENIKYKPILGRYTVIIIDEVHMLSKGAFNALLKTLEEPPMHVVFILATTELHKIPTPVISRCQRYDLSKLSLEKISGIISSIANKENIFIEESVISIIARYSYGSARNAIFILDQAINYNSSNTVTSNIVNEILNLVSTEYVVKLCKYIIDFNAEQALDIIHYVFNNYNNLEGFIISVANYIEFLNKKMIIPHYNDAIYNIYEQETVDILKSTDLPRISILWQIFDNGIQHIYKSYNTIATAEMLIIKAMYYERISIPSNDVQNSNILDDINFTQQHVVQYRVVDFLKYLHSNKEMDIYYTMFDDVQIDHFKENENSMKISIYNKKYNIKELHARIEQLLLTWSKVTWNVDIQYTNHRITTFKEVLMQNAQLDQHIVLLKQYFPEIQITDIVLNDT